MQKLDEVAFKYDPACIELFQHLMSKQKFGSKLTQFIDLQGEELVFQMFSILYNIPELQMSERTKNELPNDSKCVETQTDLSELRLCR